MNGPHPDGATPLTPAEETGLIPAHITQRRELNALEQANLLAMPLGRPRFSWGGSRLADPGEVRRPTSTPFAGPMEGITPT